MFDWLKKSPGEKPNFWRAYEDLYLDKSQEEIRDLTFTVFDTETTGFDYDSDRILSIGAVSIHSNTIDVMHSFEVYLEQNRFNSETVKIHGIRRNENIIKESEREAIKNFIEYIGDSVLVAHHASFDINMINRALQRMHLPKLKNKVLDTGRLYNATRINSNLIDKNKNYSLDEIAEAFTIDVKDRHTAAGDAFITAIAFLNILGRLNKSKNLKLKDLLTI